MTPIDFRIIEAVRRAVGRGYEPRLIYLDSLDRHAFSEEHGVAKIHVDGIEVRAGYRSRLICRGGAALSVPKYPHRSPPWPRLLSNQKRLMLAAMR